MTDRRFNDKEVALILKRAAEMSHASTAGGFSVAELERIALEAGLDPAAVRQAADEVSRGEASAGGTGRALLGGPTVLRYTFELDGELSEEHHEALLASVQRNLDFPGTLNTAGRTFSWHAQGPNRSVLVQVAPGRGKTTVRVEERLGSLIGGIYGGVGGGVGGSLVPFAAIGAGALLGPIGVAIALTASLAATYAGTRAIFKAVAKRRQQALERLSDDLRQVLGEVLVPPAAPPSSPAATRSDESALKSARERQGLAPAPDRQSDALDDDAAEGAEAQVSEASAERSRQG